MAALCYSNANGDTILAGTNSTAPPATHSCKSARFRVSAFPGHLPLFPPSLFDPFFVSLVSFVVPVFAVQRMGARRPMMVTSTEQIPAFTTRAKIDPSSGIPSLSATQPGIAKRAAASVGTFRSHAGNLNSAKRNVATPIISARGLVCALNMPCAGLRTRRFL